MRKLLALLGALLVCWGGFPAPASAAFGTPYELASPTTSTSTSTTFNYTVATPPAAGDWIVLLTRANNATAVWNSVSDNSSDGGTWTSTTQVVTSNNRVRMWAKKVPVSWSCSPCTIAVSVSSPGSSNKHYIGIGFSGADAQDKVLNPAGSNSTSAPSITHTQLAANNEILVAALVATSGQPITEPTGFTKISGLGATGTVQLSTKVVSSDAGATYTWAYGGSSGEAVVQMMSFTDAAPPPPPPATDCDLLLGVC